METFFLSGLVRNSLIEEIAPIATEYRCISSRGPDRPNTALFLLLHGLRRETEDLLYLAKA